MNKILIWDWPVRALHWAFAGSLTAALVIGFGFDDEHPLFAYHMLLGLVAGFIVLLRIVLGVVGSRHARFAAWAWSPVALVRYVRSLFRPDAPRHVSHNPGSTWVSAAMFVVVGLLIATGIVAGKQFEDTHEVLALVLVSAIGLHLLGLAWHTFRFRENIAQSMIDGRKVGPPEEALTSSHRIAGLVVVVLAVGWSLALFRGYDAGSGRVRLPVLGTDITLNRDDHAAAPRPDSRQERRHE